jgi:hypothetical protein
MSEIVTPAEPTYRYFGLVRHAHEPQVLLLPGENGFRLPQWEFNHWVELEVQQANQAVYEQLGVRATVLQYFHVEMNRPTRLRRVVYEMENHSPEWSPPVGGRWVEAADLSDLSFADPDQKLWVENYFTEAKEAVSPLRPGWAFPGWFAGVEKWFSTQLEEAGLKPTGRLEHLKTWAISCILRQPTTGGDLYFKAVPPLFGTEPLMTRLLADYFPANIPEILAINETEGWMLMKDFSGETLKSLPEMAAWEAVLRQFGRLQAEAVPYLDKFIEGGIRQRPLERLPAYFEALLDDTEMLLLGQERGISEAQLEELRGLVPVVTAACRKLAEYGLPAGLDHGDFHSGNVVFAGGKYIIYDWTDITVSHPFFSLFTLFDSEEIPVRETVPNWQNRLRDVYLEAWTNYAPMERLIEAFEIAYPLGIIVQALNYQWIVQNQETKSKAGWIGAISYYLKKYLEYRAEHT